METKFYNIKASLKPCVLADFYSNKKIIENSVYYLKNYQGEFYGIFVIDQVYYNNCEEENLRIEKYYKNQIIELLTHNLAYKLADSVNFSDYTCNFYLKTAENFELFQSDTSNDLILNTTYFCLNQENQILGPFKTKENHSGAKFREFFNKGLLLVPTKKQTFEPITNAKAS